MLPRVCSIRVAASRRLLPLLSLHTAAATAAAPTVVVAVRHASTSAALPPPRRRRLAAPFVPLRPLSKRIRSAMAQANASACERMRANMERNKIAAFVVPTADAHQSEYVSDADKRRAFLTNFTGSAGTAVVLAAPFTDQAAAAKLDDSYGPPDVCGRLFTDGRYFLQAAKELNPKEFTLMKSGVEGVPKLEEWLMAVLPAGSRVAIDPRITSIASYKALKSAFKERLSIVFVERNLVDEVWTDRPAYSTNPLMILADSYTGETSASKIARIRAKMVASKATILIAAALDEVAWLFNMRGSDISFNPVFRSYALVTPDTVSLYCDVEKVTPEIRAHLGDGVSVRPYDALWAELAAHAAGSQLGAERRVWLDTSKVSVAIQSVFTAAGGPGADAILEQDNPIQLMKAVKNATEIAGMRNAHIKDAAAVINFLSWLECELIDKGNTGLNEVSVADRLEAFRAEQPDFVGLSFDTIAGSGPNGAIIHYRAEAATARSVNTKEMFLLDSGAQFRDGTTDITRTVKFSPPTDFERESFTRVLLGHISLASAVFPAGTVGPTLDAFARQSLWSAGLDYVHGTGHGVGAFLNVHEGPIGISSSGRSHSALNTPLQAGMVLSNEPGYYEDGQFGIRIESLVVVSPRQTAHQFMGKSFFGFDTITLVPIQRTLIALPLLSDAQLQWLNDYHRRCRDTVAPLLQGRAKDWLMRETEPIVRA